MKVAPEGLYNSHCTRWRTTVCLHWTCTYETQAHVLCSVAETAILMRNTTFLNHGVNFLHPPLKLITITITITICIIPALCTITILLLNHGVNFLHPPLKLITITRYILPWSSSFPQFILIPDDGVVTPKPVGPITYFHFTFLFGYNKSPPFLTF